MRTAGRPDPTGRPAAARVDDGVRSSDAPARVGVMVRGLVAVLLAFGLLAAGVPNASAHATLLLTDPANGVALDAMPAAVTLTFNQPQLEIGSNVSVIGPGGVVSAGKPRMVDREVTQAIEPGAPEGTYSVAWRFTSVDGHVISGLFGFTVGTPTGAVPAASVDYPEEGLSPLVWVLIGAAVLVVVAGTVLAVRRPPTRAADEGDPVPAGTSQDRQDSPPA